MTINSRDKGASFERAIAKELELLTGVRFKRDTEQYRESELGDLVPSDPAWPFSLELKRYAEGKSPLQAWFDQAERAAAKSGKFPALIWKYDRLPVRCAVPFAAIGKAVGGTFTHDEYAQVSLEGLAYLAREIMARNADAL